MRIEIQDPVWSRFSPKEDIDKILPCLTYEKEGWYQGEYKKEKSKCSAYMINKSGRVLTGLIPRIWQYCERTNLGGVPIDGYTEFLEPDKPLPILPGFIFREDQLKAIVAVIANQRGIIKNATGTGKTVVAGAICSIWPSKHIIFLCHTLDLLSQAERAFTQQFGFKNIWTLGDGKNKFDWPKAPTILISTVQTLRRMDLMSYCDWADIVIVDECHHLQDKDGMMAEVLKQTMAPVRIGLSAELPKTEKGKLVLEGYIGPIIGEFTYQEGVKAGILAKPLMNLIAVPYNDDIGDTAKYGNTVEEGIIIAKGMYQRGIIENKSRNRLALTEAINSVENGDSVLILTARDTQHGFIIQEMARDIFDIEIPFIYGDTKKDDRQIMQDLLQSKQTKLVCSNVVWKEGINIPSLDHVINIGGEKFPTQIVGRGSRATATKKFVKVTDFLDPYRFLSHHTVMRLIVYAGEGWLNFHHLKGDNK